MICYLKISKSLITDIWNAEYITTWIGTTHLVLPTQKHHITQTHTYILKESRQSVAQIDSESLLKEDLAQGESILQSAIFAIDLVVHFGSWNEIMSLYNMKQWKTLVLKIHTNLTFYMKNRFTYHNFVEIFLTLFYSTYFCGTF